MLHLFYHYKKRNKQTGIFFYHYLTFLRIIVVPFIVCLILVENSKIIFKYLGLIIYLFALLTDIFDGYLSRKKNLSSLFGQTMDSVADKILECSVLISFASLKLIPAWMVIVIVMREFFILGIRSISINNEIISNINFFLGRIRLIYFKFVNILIFVFLCLKSNLDFKQLSQWKVFIYYLILIGTIFTISTAIFYIFRDRRKILASMMKQN